MKHKKTLALLTVLILAGASYVLGWSTLFTVSSVEITGTKTLLPQSVKIGEKLARVEPRAIAAKYESIDAIRDAKISRNWITGKVSIEITMRTPIAIYNNKAIDELGKTFVINGQRPSSLPTIQASNIEVAFKAVNFFTLLPNDLKSKIEVIKVRSTGIYVLEVKLEDRILELVWGTPTENALKARVYKALLAQSENAKIVRMDLAAPHAPIVK